MQQQAARTPRACWQRVGTAVESCGLQVVADQAVRFDGGGYTLVWVLAESHLVLHLWPERGYATVRSARLRLSRLERRQGSPGMPGAIHPLLRARVGFTGMRWRSAGVS